MNGGIAGLKLHRLVLLAAACALVCAAPGAADPTSTVSESVTTADAVSTVTGASSQVGENVSSSDTLSTVVGQTSSVGESVLTQDSVVLVPGKTVSVGEGITPLDSVSTRTGQLLNVLEGITASDSVSTQAGQLLNVLEGVTPADQVQTQIVNTAPTVDAGPDLSGVEGTAVTGSGSFADPDTQTWTATVDYGDGTGVQPLTLVGKTFQLSHVYDDNGSYTITVKVNDGLATGTDTVGVTVRNVAPTATVSNSGPIPEGSSATITLSNPFDPSRADTQAGFRYAFACDGSQLTLGLATPLSTPSTACAFDDNGTYPVLARILDKDGGYTDYTTNVVVNNVAPTATLSNNGPVGEGSPATITFSAQSDPSQADTAAGFSYQYACDNGTLGAPTPSPSTTCTFDDGPSSHTVLARISDKDGGYTDYRTTVTVTNVAPTATLFNNGPVNEGSPVTVSFSGQFDPSHADTAAGFKYQYACVGSTLGAATLSSSTTCTFDDNGTYPVLARILDKDGGSTDYTTTVTVNNVSPTATFVAPTSAVNEGSTFTLALTNPSDPSHADTTAGFTLAFDCGDGKGYQPSATCTAVDNPSQAVKGRITDKDGGSTEYAATVPVANVAPTVTITGPPSGALYQVGQPVTFTGTFTDPGIKDTHTALWSFDALTAPGSVTETNGSGSTMAIYTFTQAGVYSVQLKVTDKDGGVGTASTVNGLDALVVVYDPSAGFVIGGGWINSPPGAYVANPSLSGMANFGFVSKYQKGANVPTGNTEFQFKAASFNFHSSSYQWLVVAGSKAQFKGTGEVNGVPGYGFLLTAWDGNPDRFRIKVWDSSGTTVYDNALGSSDDIDIANPEALSGGSIVIQK